MIDKWVILAMGLALTAEGAARAQRNLKNGSLVAVVLGFAGYVCGLGAVALAFIQLLSSQ